MVPMNKLKNRAGVQTILLGLLMTVAFALFAASPANAQDPCEQYPNSEDCQGGIGPEPGGGDDDGNLPGGEDTGAGTGNLGDGDGALPFTGYPLTPLVMLLMILLGLGLMARAYVFARERAKS